VKYKKTKKIMSRLYAVLVFLSLCDFTYSQSNHFFKEIGWSLKVPADFTLFDSATSAQIVDVGKQQIEQTINRSINTSDLKGLIAMSKGNLEYFSASLNTDKSITQENWQQLDKSVKETYYKSSVAKLPNAKVDSLSSIKTIGNLPFNKLVLSFKINPQLEFHAALLSTYYKNSYFSITYVYVYKETEQEINTMLNESKFNR
jgi:hypothetical protein